MTFTAKPLSALPKREPPKPKEVDLEAAKALYAILSKNDKPATMADPADPKRTVTVTAEDGVAYDSIKTARNAANVAKRLLGHVTPDALFIKTRVYPTTDGGPFAFAIWLSVEAPAAKGAAKTK
jgi:pectin methylesterase-like acyl-CoA thioesterase